MKDFFIVKGRQFAPLFFSCEERSELSQLVIKNDSEIKNVGFLFTGT